VLVAARRTAKATVSAHNTSHIPIALGPQLENPRKATIARAMPVVVAAALEVVVAAAVAAEEAHPTVSAEELWQQRSRRLRPREQPRHRQCTRSGYDARHRIDEITGKRPLKQATTTTSPPILQDFATCFFLRNSNLSGSPSTTRSKTQSSGSDVMPWPLKTLVATTTPSAGSSPSACTKLHSHGSSHSKRTRSTNGTS
jgi:hypothetical protein